MSLLPYRLEHVCSYSATLTPPEAIGALPEGLRINFYVTGGKVEGPKLKGILRAVGGDWLTLRTDGVVVLDVRATMETHDGALIYVTYGGIGDLGVDGYAKFLAGEMPAKLALRTAPRMHTSHADYLWVNRLQYLSVGEVDFAASHVIYDTYAAK